jgi:glutathione S-transferase
LYQLNPLGQIPVITYGDPPSSDGVPSPTAFKLAESTVIAEFIADLYPNAGLLPPSPTDRAKIRFFIDTATKGLIASTTALLFKGGSHEESLKHIDTLQGLLDPKSDSTYFVGDRITLADATIAPFAIALANFGRSEIAPKSDGEIAKLLAALKGEKYAVFNRYSQGLVDHPSVKANFNDVSSSARPPETQANMSYMR